MGNAVGRRAEGPRRRSTTWAVARWSIRRSRCRSISRPADRRGSESPTRRSIKTLAAERVTFDPAERKKALNAAFKAIQDAAPGCFMWRHHMLYGMSKTIEHKPNPAGRIFGTEIVVK